MAKLDSSFPLFEQLMRAHNLPEIVVNNFHYYYNLVLNGERGLISEEEISPIDSVEGLEQLEGYIDAGKTAMSKAVIIKLNGGLGTSMGLDKAKSLLTARKDLNFLDISIRQVLALREKYSTYIPLIFMNSYNTDSDTQAVIDTYPHFKGVVPATMTQYKVPKVLQDTLAPAVWPENTDLEWCPPGHGEVYIALETTGILDSLLEKGYEYAFISNIDNLGATLDLGILGYLAQNKIPFMMEVVNRTPADKKGGHLARHKDGHLVLREVAQCPEKDIDSFQDITKYKYFNSNNLWINLRALKTYLNDHNNVLGLPLIRNSKTVDPKQKNSPKVFQLETAMGSAISVFPGAQAVRVTKARFLPIKTCADLLALRSDIYKMDDEYNVYSDSRRKLGTIKITLDDEYYKLISDFESRVQVVPSLLHCQNLDVEGEVCFNKPITVKGYVTLVNTKQHSCNLPDSDIFENGTFVCR
ncbi:MAG: UTP--glucose-1-phosphate uridylyltransferase [bacterium]|nr:UTP--glucose-1-phosphate uridylyltransferase [bacterium]